jgi:hypothetical protein
MLIREVLLLAADRRRGTPGRGPKVSFPARSPTHAAGHQESVGGVAGQRSFDLATDPELSLGGPRTGLLGQGHGPQYGHTRRGR